MNMPSSLLVKDEPHSCLSFAMSDFSASMDDDLPEEDTGLGIRVMGEDLPEGERRGKGEREGIRPRLRDSRPRDLLGCRVRL